MLLKLQGKKGLILGVANDQSIAWGCAKVLHGLGAEICLTYGNPKTRNYTEKLADQIHAPVFTQMNTSNPEQVEEVFGLIKEQCGTLDFIIHSIAFCPAADLHGPVSEVTRNGFASAVDISWYSLMLVARQGAKFMKNGGSITAMSYYGSQKVIQNYNIMGPIKAALESSVRYLAVELGEKNIRVNAISPGPIATRAASGISGFDKLIADNEARSPLKEKLTIEDIGQSSAFLISDMSKRITGQVLYVDNGMSIIG